MPLGKYTPQDPRGLIHEAYHMDIVIEDCRSIFFDWALGWDGETSSAIETLLARYSVDHADHPMTLVLREGLQQAAAPKRRGGRSARV